MLLRTHGSTRKTNTRGKNETKRSGSQSSTKYFIGRDTGERQTSRWLVLPPDLQKSSPAEKKEKKTFETMRRKAPQLALVGFFKIQMIYASFSLAFSALSLASPGPWICKRGRGWPGERINPEAAMGGSLRPRKKERCVPCGNPSDYP